MVNNWVDWRVEFEVVSDLAVFEDVGPFCDENGVKLIGMERFWLEVVMMTATDGCEFEFDGRN